MYNQEVFSWAEDFNGKMVYVDDVPRGGACNCICPNCQEKLIARHGVERTHGFAHASKERGANLNICLKVIIFKLAEQIIATEKRVCIPSYYGIFKSKIIEFKTVEINDCFEREDRQPDIIATTKDNQKYLIDFCFKDYVRHKQNVNYESLNCIEIDLAGQKIDDRNSLKEFLLNSDKSRRWLNNDMYFNSVEQLYQSRGKKVRIVSEEECTKCILSHSCCAVRNKTQICSLLLYHNDKPYRLCKSEEYWSKIEAYNNYHKKYNEDKYELSSENNKLNYEVQQVQSKYDINVNDVEVSCFNCQINLQWANRDGLANCGSYETFRLPKRIDPSYAKRCTHFIKKK